MKGIIKYSIFFLLLCWILYPKQSYRIVTLEQISQPAVLKLEPAKSFAALPQKKLVPPKTSTVRFIKPSDVPYTKPWYYRGPLTLKQHINLEHFVLLEVMTLFETESDLKKLHSFLHNRGDLNNL
jgi:hypothetical protein